jgi:hypothetical protein
LQPPSGRNFVKKRDQVDYHHGSHIFNRLIKAAALTLGRASMYLLSPAKFPGKENQGTLPPPFAPYDKHVSIFDRMIIILEAISLIL